MGAVCYKAKRASISKEDILRALNDKHIRETITEPDTKTLKTDEQQNHVTFTNFTSHAYLESAQEQSRPLRKKTRNPNLNPPQQEDFSQMEIKILSYFSHKEDIYKVLAQMGRKSLYFLRKNYKKIEKDKRIKHANEKIKFVQLKSIEEHNSGINQMLRINNKDLVTASDDCTLKFWSDKSFKIESQIMTETITCIAMTGSGKQKDILVAGCHSGNLIMINALTKSKKEQINMAHYNLIRVIVSLETLKNRFFVTADVCGIVKVWTSQFKPLQLLEIEQEGAISYNSMIEVTDYLPKRPQYEESALIACALKSQKVNLILVIPSQAQYQVLKTFRTSQKPTCLIQLSTKHLAIAVGSLKEQSNIEIHHISKEQVVSTLSHHTDMIDSLLKLEFPEQMSKTDNAFVQWMLSASRDRNIILWKLIDGKVMKRHRIQLLNPNPPKLQQRRSIKREEENKEDEQERQQDQQQQQQQQEEQKTVEVSRDYFYLIETTHKDFIRSMVQLNDNMLVTASEDKTIKIFNIVF